MIQLQIHPDQIEWLVDELRIAGEREMGGVLVGEHLSDGRFRIVDLSAQHFGGTTSCFVCEPSAHQSFLDEFFEQTGNDFARYNYLGEWHSHPLFSVAPSETDLRQMQALVEDEPGQRLFAVLLIVRLATLEALEIGALIFRPGTLPVPARIEVVHRQLDDVAKKKPTSGGSERWRRQPQRLSR